MRQIINISLPPKMAKAVHKEVKEEGFASVSEFFRYILREWHTNKLAKELKQQTKDFNAGKGIELKSFSDLDK